MIGLMEDVAEMFAGCAAGIDTDDIAEGFGDVGYRDTEASKGAAWLRANGHEVVGEDHGDRLVRASAEYIAAERETIRAYRKTPSGRASRAKYNLRRRNERKAQRGEAA